MTTLQIAIRDRLRDETPILVSPEPGGLGFTGVFAKWLTQEGPGAEPGQFDITGRIVPSVVVWSNTENPHPSPHVPGWRKWDAFPSVYLIHYPHEHGKDVLDQAKLAVESSLTDPAWHPVITGGQRPTLELDTETHLDNTEQFPGNYVIVLRFRATGARALSVS